MKNKEMAQSIILKVAEAESKDVGRAIARTDPSDAEKLMASSGEIIKIVPYRSSSHGSENVSSRVAVARLMPTHKDFRGQRKIQIDGIARENLNVGIGEKVILEKVHYTEAHTIVLVPCTARSSFQGEDSQYFSEMLDGVPVIKGTKIRITFFGTRAQDFLVEATDPEDVVLIKPTTRIQFKDTSTGKQGVGVTYEDIGGLKKEMARIREMVELPLKYPEIFERLGIDPPKGVLLVGPPGCGKTLIARAIAYESDAYFTHISGPEIMGRFYGESEGRLREVFEEVKAHAPAILFIDEIDAIAPKREELGGEKQVEKRVVAQLLALMDGLESRGEVVVIGATNIPNTLDPALRRPGRFDREITLPIPDRNARFAILEIYTRGMPLASDVELERLADVTHGFVGADLEALAREAAMVALRSFLGEGRFDQEYITYENLRKIKVSKEHFYEALREVEPSALREVFCEIPHVRWEDIGGLEGIKQTLKEVIEWPIKYRHAFEQVKISPTKGILLYGAPGCGKTLLAKAVASESGVNFISVKGPALLSRYIGESERGIREVFKKARMAAPCVLFFDEIDSLTPKRGSNDASPVTERVMSQFLVEMDGIEALQGVVVLGATNRLDIIDPAMLRAGRFDFLIEVSAPNEQARYAIFTVHTRNKPIDKAVNLEDLVKVTEGFTGAEIEFLCKNAALCAIRENLESNNLTIMMRHFEDALKHV